MKIELFVLDIDYYPEIRSLTLPGLERYAKSIGAKFTCITERKFPDKHIVYEKMQVYELGKGNDWNILIDCDMIIKEGMYNVIPLVPDDGNHIGAWEQFWKENLYKGRGIDVTIAGNFIVVPSKCHEIFKPLDASERYDLYLEKEYNIDEYTFSLNRQRLGYKLAGLELPNSYGRLFEHLNATTSLLDKEEEGHPVLRGSAKFMQGLDLTPLVAAEIGVRRGSNAKILLDNLNIDRLYLVDPFLPYKDHRFIRTKEYQDKCYKDMFNLLSLDNRVVFVHKTSEEASELFPDNFFDYVYLDADHSYDNLSNDISYWFSKVKVDGFICGHDYLWFFPGVKQAIEEFSEKSGLSLISFGDGDWLFQKTERKPMNAVVTIAMGDTYQTMGRLTHPSIKAYADKIGADFICIDKQKVSKTTPHWEKFQLFDLLNKYERIIYLDTDIIIREDCPNLFDVVPSGILGAFNEARFTDRSRELMIDICKQYNVALPDWDGRYFNTGVLVVSRHHKPLFKKPENEVCNFYEQSYLNMIFAKEKVQIFELEHKFNRMTCMDRYTGEERFASYIIHYAGVPDSRLVLQLIPKDLARWDADKGDYNYKHHIYISVSGGYGDQIAAEPAVRFMREKLYPDADFVIATHWPRIYSHMELGGAVVCKQGEANLKGDTPYFIAQSLPGPDKLQWSMVSHLLCHTIDYASISLMKRTIPISDRKIKFVLTQEDFENLYLIVDGKKDFSESVVVHPGSHWDSKTFPVSWWQSVIDGLVSKGKNVCIVGKDDAGDHPFYQVGKRGTVDVQCPEGCHDFRNLLDVGGLAALLSLSGTLVSNDSFPIHLAGAFDNQIILIPSCKHPDHILPWRNGSQYYKAKALYKRLVLDDVESRPTQVYETSAEVKNINWDNYLVPPEEVVSEIGG